MFYLIFGCFFSDELTYSSKGLLYRSLYNCIDVILYTHSKICQEKNELKRVVLQLPIMRVNTAIPLPALSCARNGLTGKPYSFFLTDFFDCVKKDVYTIIQPSWTEYFGQCGRKRDQFSCGARETCNKSGGGERNLAHKFVTDGWLPEERRKR